MRTLFVRSGRGPLSERKLIAEYYEIPLPRVGDNVLCGEYSHTVKEVYFDLYAVIIYVVCSVQVSPAYPETP